MQKPECAGGGKEIKLTEKHIQGFMGAYNDMVKVYRRFVARFFGRYLISVGQYISGHVRHRPADQEVHRATRTDQEGDRGTQGGQNHSVPSAGQLPGRQADQLRTARNRACWPIWKPKDACPVWKHACTAGRKAEGWLTISISARAPG